jgi:hypothetical protein
MAEAYTDQDVELVAAALGEVDFRGKNVTAGAKLQDAYDEKARAVLDALATARRLIPANAVAIATTDDHLYQLSDVSFVIPDVGEPR